MVKRLLKITLKIVMGVGLNKWQEIQAWYATRTGIEEQSFNEICTCLCLVTRSSLPSVSPFKFGIFSGLQFVLINLSPSL